ncbi:BTAD domain-containing putative transcriptional regulator [Actinokineospora soli]|uniref:BTAD domain-containing putative transcriptional regulator n=1 Tax=Actinokineospora soli TaxID=1048753 RepID=A0ABW2TGR6_9PSEU
MSLGILGPVRAVRGESVVRVGPRERAVLARLVLDANRVVSVDRLIDAVWQGAPPASARGQVAICVSRLRKSLGPVIATASPGYVVRLDEEGSDWARFNALVSRARSADRTKAVGLLREALNLWRGVPFEDVPGLRAEAARLQSARLDAAEACAELELELGLHDRVGKDLAALVAEHPLRERARAQLMVAHYRAGRRAEALRVYQDARRALVEQIGLEPGPQLRGLHDQILRDALPTPVVGEVPSQLPRQPLPFAGRTFDLAALDDALADDPGAVVLYGPREVGKTALALHWAHHRIDRFPDGQLHADLVGETGRPVPPGVVLDRFLRALGVRSIPEEFGEKVAVYRSGVARRRLLVVLDGAVDAAQLLPLLPGGPHTRVIVTSRQPLDEFAARSGARQHVLEPLAYEESRALLSMLLGPEWLAAQPQEAAHIARQAAGFPLPVRRAAARLRRQTCVRSRNLISA